MDRRSQASERIAAELCEPVVGSRPRTRSSRVRASARHHHKSVRTVCEGTIRRGARRCGPALLNSRPRHQAAGTIQVAPLVAAAPESWRLGYDNGIGTWYSRLSSL
jgi:hypothetical protein